MKTEGNFIKLFRTIDEWEWSDDPVTFRVWIYILTHANWKDNRWHGMEIKRGQLITGLEEIATTCGLTIQNVRTGLLHLVDSGEINKQPTNKGTILTVCKWDSYQGENDGANKQLTNDQQTKNSSFGEINKKSTNKIPTLTVCKCDSYQGENDGANKRLTNDQQTTNNSRRIIRIKERTPISPKGESDRDVKKTRRSIDKFIRDDLGDYENNIIDLVQSNIDEIVSMRDKMVSLGGYGEYVDRCNQILANF